MPFCYATSAKNILHDTGAYRQARGRARGALPLVRAPDVVSTARVSCLRDDETTIASRMFDTRSY